eukprot:comp21156_c0_seq2/m.44860 comp21156_c0_seq2/g.44860  ORF comp21156_c0_seq2/g.44860 comp21156_c0_seq2/m.44860 type:complete len:262 (-) comp21156_c0_seq2:19-804(-)
MSPEPFRVNKVTITDYDEENGVVVQAKWKAVAMLEIGKSKERQEGIEVPGIVVARGGTSVIFIVLVVDNVEYVVLQNIFCVPTGNTFPALPRIRTVQQQPQIHNLPDPNQPPVPLAQASTASRHSGKSLASSHQDSRSSLDRSFSFPPGVESILTSVFSRNITETELSYLSRTLLDLTALAYGGSNVTEICPSGGGCDERLKVLCFRVAVHKDVIPEIRHRGYIVEKLNELWMRSPDGASLSALSLYYNLKSRDKLVSRWK